MTSIYIVAATVMAILCAGLFGGATELSGLTANADILPLAFAFGLVNAGKLQSANISFQAVFKKAFTVAPESALRESAMLTASTTKEEEYGWIGNLPGLRHWIGDRAVKDLAADGYRIKNRDYESTVAVSSNDIDDDKLGVYTPLFQELAANAKQHPGDLIGDMISDGETKLCYDGAEFFDAAHPNGDLADQSNLLTSAALNATNYNAARVQMAGFKNAEGQLMKIQPTHLVVPRQLEPDARAILNADTVIGDDTAGGSKANVWKSSAELIVADELNGDATSWYLACLNRTVKPFILQMRQEPAFIALNKPTDQSAFMRKEYMYGVDYRGAVGYGMWQLIIKNKA